MPCTAGSAFSRSSSASNSPSLVFSGKPVLEGAHARFLRRPALIAHIHLAGRIVADKHHRKAGLDALRGFEFAGENADTFA